ncbi:hypothetical protein BLNAU_22848 [Blattamonas nauphoetae]|uniref:Uncharacterized protein n=1 Tax=Blattamonas nauphoetae TaxID=2049346 RepID=A0ABQ9WRY2_9EUKA|nr:hypothetical protein BLNAU_22848 [Blattamonas nauphoetae]
MFILFALVSASSFRAPNTPGEAPTAIALKDFDFATKIATVTLTYAGTDAVAADDALILSFDTTPAGAAPIDVPFAVPTGHTPAATLDVTIESIGTTGKLQLDTKYKLVSYSYKGTAGAVSIDTEIEFATPTDPTDPEITILLAPKTKTSYDLTVTVGTAVGAEETIDITFKAGDVEIKPLVKIPADAKTVTVAIPIAAAAADNTLVIGTEYTITVVGYTPSQPKFTPADLNKLAIASKLTPAEEGKKDGAKDKIALTIENGLLPAALPEGGKQELKLTTVAATSNAEYVLDKSDKITWTHSAGKIVVDYLFNDCKVAAGTDLTADLTINDDLKFAAQAFKYEEGAKSVASVVAALFAVLALVF